MPPGASEGCVGFCGPDVSRARQLVTVDDIRLAAVLNGAFATPFVAYELNARALTVSGTTIELLQARGRAKVDADRIRIPVQARARRISGLDPSLGSLLTNVTVNGTLNISGTRLLHIADRVGAFVYGPNEPT